MAQKIVQYLNEAHATEAGLIRVLQSQAAMTPRGPYRSAVETHLRETRDHAKRIERRLDELGGAGNPITATVGVVETIVSQVLALSKTPVDLLRGTSGPEKILKNAKDTCATEALEIATYVALEELASQLGDETTARLAREIRADEERMLETVRGQLPDLTHDVARNAGFDVTKTGAADAVRNVAKEAGATEPWRGYDNQTVDQITKRIGRMNANDRKRVARYERAHRARVTILEAANRDRANA